MAGINLFRTLDGKLDREYLRTCAIYNLLKLGKIDRYEASMLANKPFRGAIWRKRNGWLDNTISIWVNGPLAKLGRIDF